MAPESQFSSVRFRQFKVLIKCSRLVHLFTLNNIFWSWVLFHITVGSTPESKSILKCILGPRKCLVQANFSCKKFWFKNNLGRKNFVSKKVFGPKIVLTTKKILGPKILGPYIFWVRKKLKSKGFWYNKILGQQKI